MDSAEEPFEPSCLSWVPAFVHLSRSRSCQAPPTSIHEAPLLPLTMAGNSAAAITP
jgi:hypothetical protein